MLLTDNISKSIGHREIADFDNQMICHEEQNLALTFTVGQVSRI